MSLNELDKRENRYAPWLASLLILIIWAGWNYFMGIFPNVPNDVAGKGSYGSSYTALNAIFSGAALMGVVYNLIKSERDSVKRQKERQEDQIENRFFKLFELWLSNVDSLEHQTRKTNLLGRAEPLKMEYREHKGRNALYALHKAVKDKAGGTFADNYNTVFNGGGEALLSPYLRLLYRIYKFIDESDLSTAKKKDYSNTVRAVLSSKELALLGANCLTDQGENFSIYVDRYDILKHITNDVLWLNMRKADLLPLIKAKAEDVIEKKRFIRQEF